MLERSQGDRSFQMGCDPGCVFLFLFLFSPSPGQLVEGSGVPRRAEGTRVEPPAAAGPLFLPPLPGQH